MVTPDGSTPEIPQLMEKLVSLSKQRGFIFPGSDIYGGLANSWDFGPLGAQLKRNLKNIWWNEVVEKRANMYGLDGSILMNPKVWEASGHVETFHDPLVEDVVNNKRYRADHLLEAAGIDPIGLSLEEMAKALAENNILSADGNALSEPKQFNMMFQTTIGPVSDSGDEVFLRPETAQSMFVNFKNIMNTMRPRLPFGMAQIGKAFRNEITPGNFIFRTLEFEQMEIEYFIEESDWEATFTEWQSWMHSFAGRIGISAEKLSVLEVPEGDLAHYSKRTIDFEFDFPFGTEELWGLAYRTDFDLSNHTQHSSEKLEYTDPQDNKRKFTPHVVEPTMGVERTILAVLASAYTEETLQTDTGEDKRIVMRFTPDMAPYQVAVLPLMRKKGLDDKAKEIFTELQSTFRCEYDETQSIGKRYRRQDEIGTPICVTIDFDTIENGDNCTVTLRHRDTMEQLTVPLDVVEEEIRKMLNTFNQ